MATSAQRQRMFRKLKADQDLTEVRGIFAPPEFHKLIKEGAKSIVIEEGRRKVMRLMSADLKAMAQPKP